MQTYRTETIVSPDRVLTVRGVPFRAGEKVEVIVLSSSRKRETREHYPLRGKPIRYVAPFDSVAEGEWLVLQ
ncbi:MAG: hypothetical protein WHX53_10645 [Anaerolineae bacterium]